MFSPFRYPNCIVLALLIVCWLTTSVLAQAYTQEEWAREQQRRYQQGGNASGEAQAVNPNAPQGYNTPGEAGNVQGLPYAQPALGHHNPPTQEAWPKQQQAPMQAPAKHQVQAPMAQCSVNAACGSYGVRGSCGIGNGGPGIKILSVFKRILHPFGGRAGRRGC